MNTGDDVQIVSFLVGAQEFAFDILQVERILRYEKPAELPQAPDFLEGNSSRKLRCRSSLAHRRHPVHTHRVPHLFRG